MLIHASSVAVYNKAALITGAPGSGKSDLALRLIDTGAELIADDQTELVMEAGRGLVARAPDTITGMIEVRHVGIIKMPYCQKGAPVSLIVELTNKDEVLDRLPEARVTEFLGQGVPTIRLHAYHASTPAKIKALLKYGVLTLA